MIEEAKRRKPEAQTGQHNLSVQMLERRRRINRESMRRRRAQQANSVCERQKRAREVSPVNSSLATNSLAETSAVTRRCAICRVRNAVEEVIRLLPSSRARSGYVQVRIPYCGCC
jgi:hypothetical protein